MFYLFHLFRSFLPLHNPIGFGAVDFIELGIALALVVFAFARGYLVKYARALSERTAWCMLALFVLPIALRLMLLPVHPVPAPNVSDDFSYLLLGDTLAHFRLTNPAHPMHQFFETYYVLQQPTYSSVYPLGQGIVLALGQLIFGHPWAGVAISVGALCSLCYWMLLGWTTPLWAFTGGLLCAIEFGPLSHWMNSYWGGAVSACAGCLAFGALPRLRRCPSAKYAAILGGGVALETFSRPFESIFFVISIGLLVFRVPKRMLALAALVALSLGAGLILLDNRRVTGNWVTLPYSLSRYQYGTPAAFTFQPNPTPHVQLTRQQQLAYDIQSSVHGAGVDTIGTYASRLFSRLRFYRFFLLPPLYFATLFWVVKLGDDRLRWVLATILLFALGTNFYPYFYPHYIAALTCLFILSCIISLEYLGRISLRGYPIGFEASGVILLFCFAHFLFWYGLHLSRSESMWRYETIDAINYGDPFGRIAVEQELLKTSDKQLVFVRYRPQHTIIEWVFNSADIDRSKIVWARDLGPSENEKLRRYYPDRKVWLLEADARPPALTAYQDVGQQPTPASASQQPPARLKFEDVK